ncbi:CLU1 Clustered mitochondria protein [Candida maltosa Xu316]
MSGEEEPQQQQEIVPPQELSLKIKLPKFFNTKEILTIPSTYDENVADLKQALNLVVITRNLSNYSILIQNVDVVENFGEMNTFGFIIESLQLGEDVKELDLELKEKPYTLAGVYEQITRFREAIGLHYVDRLSQDFGAAGGVSKLNGLDLDDIKPKPQPSTEEGKEEEEQKKEEEKVTVSPEVVSELFEFGKKFSSLNEDVKNYTKFDNVTDKVKIPIKSLTISQWSPVPPFQQSKGDLLYLSLQTLEHETFNITCHFSGFFVNRSSTINFNPAIKVNEKVSQLSPLFSKTMTENEINLSESSRYPETYLLPGNSFPAYPWMVNDSNLKNIPDLSRSQLPSIVNGVDGSDYIKDWNNDIQSIRELPTTNVQERIIREKLIQKSLFEFNKTATETAINIIKGNLTPMNPDEPADRFIYLKNGIFYSTGTSTVDSFDLTGGKEASRYVASKDLNTIKLINRHEVKGVSSLVTSIVDYMGKRIVCQAPVPGILDPPVSEEPVEKVVYGLSSDAGAILEDESFEEPLKQIGELFHLKPHQVQISEDVKSNSKLVVSKDTKGLRGTDGRKYVIDLYRTTPRDIQFIEENFNPNDEKSYPHGESLIRHEAVNEWWRRKVAVLFKEETEKLEKEGKLSKEGDAEKPQIAIPTDQVVFNPDSFSNDFESTEDRDEVREISKFVKEKLIEEFLDDIQDQVVPFEGKQLTEVLHRNGINLRYLGYIAQRIIERRDKYVKETEELHQANEAEAEKQRKEEAEKAKQEAEKAKEGKEEPKEEPKKEEEEEEETPTKATYSLTLANYNALLTIVIREMIARAAKHVLRELTSEVSDFLIPSVVAHFHNCLLGGDITQEPTVEIDEVYKTFYPESEFEFTKLTSKDVLQLVESQVYARFRYTLSENWISEVNSRPLFREIASKYGIQWKAANYPFTKAEFDLQQEQDKQSEEAKPHVETKSKKSKKKASPVVVTEKTIHRSSIFLADDIVSFIPLVKDSSYKSSVVEEIYTNAKSQLISGDKELGMALFNELLNINESIYGKVNPETAKFYSLVAQVYQELGFDTEAALIGRKAVILCERTCGFDSHDTITAYMNSAYYESANDQYLNSLKLYKQSMDTWNYVFGKDHPTLINTLINASESLLKVNSNDAAMQLLEEALELSKSINGEVSEITGFMYYRIANVVISLNKIKESKELFEKAYDIFVKTLGPDDSMTKQAAKYVSNVALYVEYMKRQQQEAQKKAKANGKAKAQQPAPAAGNAAANVATGSKNGKKSKKQNTPPQPIPDIANQSVDEILQFIEGGNPSKSSKKANKKK